MGRKKQTQSINISTENSNEIAVQYTPLVLRITHQLCFKYNHDFEDLKSVGYIGLLTAIDKFNPDSTQTFTQFAAYMIRFNILNYINSGNTGLIKMSSTVKSNMESKGREVLTVSSIDQSYTSDSENNNTLQNIIVGDNEDDVESIFNEEVEVLWKKVFKHLEEVFSKRDVEIFYKRYGVADRERVKGIDLAKYFNTSSVNVTLICQKILDYIRKNKQLEVILLNILKQVNN